jgi:hypothetical protein
MGILPERIVVVSRSPDGVCGIREQYLAQILDSASSIQAT